MYESQGYAVSEIKAEDLIIHESSDGVQFALIRLQAIPSASIRIHFSEFRLDEGQKLYLYTIGADGLPAGIAGPYQGTGPDVEGDWWSDPLPGNVVFAEFQFTGDAPADLPFTIDLIEQVEEFTGFSAPQSFAAAKRETMVSEFRGTVVEHEVIDGQPVLEGDILMEPEATFAAAPGARDLSEGTPGEGDVSEPGSGPKRRVPNEAVAITASRYRWPGGVVPYTISSGVNKNAINNAISHWNTRLEGVIRLVPRTNQTDYVRFVPSGSCSSYIGRIGGAQSIGLSSSCSVGNIIHEIGHAVGLYHEQSREDRNNWIRVLNSNVLLNQITNFAQMILQGTDYGYYGYNSIMHYNAYAYSTNGAATIETVPAGIPIGQREALDVSDIFAVRQMYGASNTGVWITSVPVGRQITVDGDRITTPRLFNWAPGSVHTVSAPTSERINGSDQYTFVRWTNGGAATHTITAPASGIILNATYRIQRVVNATPPASGGGNVVVTPSAPSYSDRDVVTLTADPEPGYCFTSWSGINSSAALQTTIKVNKSYNVKANYQRGWISPWSTAVTQPAAGGSFRQKFTATSGCSFMIKSRNYWIVLGKSSTKSGENSFTYTLQPNTSGETRTGYIEVGDKVMTVHQRP